MTQSATATNTDSLNALACEVETYLANRLAQVDLPDNLAAAVGYAVLGGGKRLRPGLVLLCAEACGGTRADALPAAAAIELIHAFSLVHDDLPAMDDDHLRRGQPTLHVHAGEAMAILAGDVMVSLAFEFISGGDLDSESRVALIAELSQATTAMIRGQVLDTLGGFPAGLSDSQRLHLIHQNKTGALIRAACRMGALAVAAPAGELSAMTQYGEAMGLMFQIVDDLLDVTQSTEHLGKAAGKDHAAGKLTFPGLLGVEQSRCEVLRLQQEARLSLANLGAAAQPLRELCDVMAVRTR